MSSGEMQTLARQASGDLDALGDSINEDVVRIQGPLISDEKRTFNITVNGGTVNIADPDRDIHNYAKTKVLGDHEKRFLGYVRSFNGATIQGRFWIEADERTAGFSVNNTTKDLCRRQAYSVVEPSPIG